jgi:hypothetical protein
MDKHCSDKQAVIASIKKTEIFRREGCSYINVRMHVKSYKNVGIKTPARHNEYNAVNLSYLIIKCLRDIFVF